MSLKNLSVGSRKDNITFYSLAFFMLLLPFSRAVESIYAFYFPLLLLYNLGLKGIWEKFKTTPVEIYLLFFVGYMTLTLLWTHDINTADNLLKFYLLLSLTLPIAMLTKKEWIKSLLLLFLFSLSISSMISLGHYFHLWQIRNKPQFNTSPLMFHIHYSIFMAIASISTLHFLIVTKGSFTKKLGLFLLFLAFVVTLFLSDGRTGQFSFLAALCFMIYRNFRHNIKVLLGLVMLVLLLVYGAYSFIPRFETRINAAITDIQQAKKGFLDTSLGIRFAYWILAKEIVLQEPFLGVGFGDYKSAVAEVLEKNDFGLDKSAQAFLVDKHFHNQYLMALVQGGLVGLVLLILLLTSFYRLCIPDKNFKELSLLVITVYTVGFMTEPLWLLQNPAALFSLIAGLSIAVAEPKTQNKILKPLIHINFAKSFRGGERQTLLLVQELSKKGYQQSVLTRKQAPLAQKIIELNLHGVDVIEISKPYFLSLSKIKHAHLVHAHETQGAQFAFLGSLVFKIPFLITRRVDNAIKRNFFTKAMYQHATKVIVLSKAICEKVNKLVPKAQISIIPSAFSELPMSQSAVQAIKKRYEGKFLIGNIGELDQAIKGQGYLIEAFKELLKTYPNLHLIFIGKGKDEAFYKELAKGYEDSITFEGFVHNVGDYIHAFDLFVFPSIQEGLGSILLDVMQARVPIIASDTGGIPDIIVNEKNGLLTKPKDSKELALAIKRLYSQEALRNTLTSNAFNDVQTFSPAHMVAHYEAVYKEILQ